MDYRAVRFSGHAMRQMFERGLRVEDVIAVVKDGEIIRAYPDDKPYPSCLLLGTIGSQAMHVVVAIETPVNTAVVITAYVPDKRVWNDDFRTRRGE